MLTLWNDILGIMVRVCCVISWNHLDFFPPPLVFPPQNPFLIVSNGAFLFVGSPVHPWFFLTVPTVKNSGPFSVTNRQNFEFSRHFHLTLCFARDSKVEMFISSVFFAVLHSEFCICADVFLS